MSLSTHVLDTNRGGPAAGVPVRLERLDSAGWTGVADGVTGPDGRLAVSAVPLAAGRHRLAFDVSMYQGPDGFFPEVTVVFEVTDPGLHLHLPLLLSPFGYTTYRGS
ncbi:hydroxyisourate hydrolase [Micromonospora sp. CPCC 206060]|uniref:hydroxyisourate hydrolase n=1 Tax=Micromonospora sp. CPCC 206060 TaxID=3122406 RepID=UPI002FEFFCD3